MRNLSESLKSVAINGHVSLEKALSFAKLFDQEREDTKILLRQCEKNVGMTLGEQINTHLAEMDGTKFNTMDYHYERPVGDQ